MEVRVKDGQTLADVAVQEYGSLEAGMLLARENGMSLTDVPDAGRVLQLPDAVFDRTVQEYCRVRGVSPATLRDASGTRLRVFTEEFTDEFE